MSEILLTLFSFEVLILKSELRLKMGLFVACDGVSTDTLRLES
jgi:hypothetical protein